MERKDIKRNLIQLIPRRMLEVYSHKKTDVFIISYPKCGRTWLRMLLGKAINDKFRLNINDYQMSEIYSYTRKISEVPTIQFKHFGNPHLVNYRNINRSILEAIKKKTIIVLTRNPLNVSVSYYFHLKGKSDDSILDFYADERKRIFLEITTPSATEFKRMVAESDPEKRLQDQEAFRLASEDTEIMRQTMMLAFQIEGAAMLQ